MMRGANQNFLLKSFKIGSHSGVDMQIYDLLYVDDSYFCEAKEEQIKVIRVLLVVFEAFSGPAVNWKKNCIYSIKDMALIQRLTNILGCKVEKLPTVYLGMPLENEHKELVIWDSIIGKTEKNPGQLEGLAPIFGRKNHID